MGEGNPFVLTVMETAGMVSNNSRSLSSSSCFASRYVDLLNDLTLAAKSIPDNLTNPSLSCDRGEFSRRWNRKQKHEGCNVSKCFLTGYSVADET